ncbi:MAG TPA: glutamate--tRNA ligase family protein [Vicinamibacterales bacterium]
MSAVSRFAPAPTGFLHLGHVVNAIYVWGVTRARGGRVLLRIEDHDRQRSRRSYEKAILGDLEWLGFVADEDAVRQSERTEVYEDALNKLRAAGLVYACNCSRRDFESSSESLPTSALSERRYPGTCAGKRLAESPGRGVRVRLAPSVERFTDLRLGAQEQRPSDQCGDLLAKDRQGNWTYQFAATVDDYVQGVTLVIRGEDLLSSTGRQLQLARLLGRTAPPEFLHHPLVMKSATQKLSKSDGDTGIRELRERDWKPGDVIGHAAWLAGLVGKSQSLDPTEVSTVIV